MSAHFGFAVDVGTTTIVAELIELHSGDVVASSSRLNPQALFGADVMTRIAHAQAVPDGADQLHNILIDVLIEMFGECMRQGTVVAADIGDAIFVGNATMMHTLVGADPTPLGILPYRGALEQGWSGAAASLRLGLPNATAYVPCGIRSHVGADTVAGILATELDRSAEPALLVDLGTNSEVVLAHPRGLLCTSTAAGPAFEAEAPGRLRGSQLITAVAQRLRTGVIEPSGRMRVADAEVSPAEVRLLQLAKAGVAAGMRVLLGRVQLAPAQLDRVLLAGAFGNYLDADSALAIGLLPGVGRERVHFVGNAALAGARLLLLDHGARTRAQALARRARYVELGGHEQYANAFVEEIALPHPRTRMLETLGRITTEIEQRSRKRCPYRGGHDACTFRGPCQNRIRRHGEPVCGGGILNSSPA